MLLPSFAPDLVAPASIVDLAIVGAGPAGIAAARAGLASGLTVAVLESRARVGGRVVTASFGGHPVDLGAHWLHAGALNPLVALARQRGENLRRSPRRGALVVDGGPQPEAERRRHADAFNRADLAFAASVRQETDRSLAQAMPPLGRWGPAVKSTMVLISGRPLHEVSARDFPSEEFGDNYFVRGGYGALLARLAARLPIGLDSPVRRIDWSGEGVVLETPRGTVRARAALVTAPMPIVVGGRIRFEPALPPELAAAIAAFMPGTYEHAILNWPSLPVGGTDRLVKMITGRRIFGLLSYMDQAPFHYAELAYDDVATTRDRAGRAALVREHLGAAFGQRAIGDLKVLHVTDWLSDPDTLGSWAVVQPSHVGDRDVISRPVGERIWFAGEANSHRLWGTAGGAWEEGERAVGAIAARLGAGGRSGR